MSPTSTALTPRRKAQAIALVTAETAADAVAVQAAEAVDATGVVEMAAAGTAEAGVDTAVTVVTPEIAPRNRVIGSSGGRVI